MNVGDTVQLTIETLVHGGDGLARLDGRIIFVPFSAPGEVVDARIVEVRSDFARAEIKRIVEASPDRIAPLCIYFGECGGCQWQHLDYPAQLRAKEAIVCDQLRRIGGFSDPPVQPTIGMVVPWQYRNHSRFTARRNGDLGYTRTDHRSFIRVDHCPISQPPINGVLTTLQGTLRGQRIHQVAVRTGARTGDLVVSPKLPDDRLESGQSGYVEEALGRRFAVSTPSFFQVNTVPRTRSLPVAGAPADPSQAEVLVLFARDRLGLSGSELLVDAYCGVGLFALSLAPHCREVIGIEESAASLRDARRNTQEGENVRFLVGRVEDILPDLAEPVDAMVIDPPRAGCKPAVLAAMIAKRPRVVCYVSCEPATLARDLKILVAGGYLLDEVQPVDMFPQTHHIEACAILRWPKGRA